MSSTHQRRCGRSAIRQCESPAAAASRCLELWQTNSLASRTAFSGSSLLQSKCPPRSQIQIQTQSCQPHRQGALCAQSAAWLGGVEHMHSIVTWLNGGVFQLHTKMRRQQQALKAQLQSVMLRRHDPTSRFTRRRAETC